MLDIKFIRENKELVKKGARDKGVIVDIEKLLRLDEKRRDLISEIETMRAEQKKLGDVRKAKLLKTAAKKFQAELDKVNVEYQQLMYQVPNLPAKDVPIGKDESGNKVLRKWTPQNLRSRGTQPAKLSFRPKDHLELGETLNLIDVKNAAKVSGARFSYLKNEAVLLEFALAQYAFEILAKEGFKPISPPVLISSKMMEAMGYLEHGGEQETYHFPKDNMYLVGTGEQSVGPMHAGEVLEEKELPLRYIAFSTCFRREAGSYGKDTRGIFRVHQFDKLEMFSFATPETGDKEHEFLLSLQEKLMRGLELPYQVVKMCTADLGDPAARKYDIETWLPSQGKYRETHSASLCTDFQARRLNIKYKKPQGKPEFVYTLNGTAFAIGRTLIAILENYQTAIGSIKVPKVLQQYMNGIKEIKRK